MSLRSNALISFAFISAADSAQAGAWDTCYVSGALSAVHGSGSAFDQPFTQGPLAGSGYNWNGVDQKISMSSDSGAAIRAGFGCDYTFETQGAPFVLGIIGDLSAGHPGGKGAGRTMTDTMISYDIDAIATLRGRAGVVQDDTLLYVTGGLALARTHSRALDTQTSPGMGLMDVSSGATELGWVVGMGMEWRLRNNLSMTIELLHHEFDGATATGAATSPSVSYPRFETTMRENTLSIGLNWRL